MRQLDSTSVGLTAALDKVKRRSMIPLDRGVLVLQAVHYGSPVALHGIVVRPDNLLKRGHGDVPRHRRAADGDGDIT